MKKMYVKPDVEILEFEMPVYMMTASELGIGAGENSEATPEGGIDANRHRGEWGDLWADDDDK